MRIRLNQKLVYWPAERAGNTGQPTFGDPEEFACRWENKITQTINGSGETIVANGVVFLEQPVEIGGLVLQGSIALLDASDFDLDNLRDNNGVREIVSISDIPALKGNQRLFTAYLV